MQVVKIIVGKYEVIRRTSKLKKKKSQERETETEIQRERERERETVRDRETCQPHNKEMQQTT